MANGDMPERVLLVGFMASGKSSVGRELASRLGWDFEDFDTVIEARAGKSVSQIFEEDGEAEFRRLESGVAEELLVRSNTVLASGGAGRPSRILEDGHRRHDERLASGVAERSGSTGIAGGAHAPSPRGWRCDGWGHCATALPGKLRTVGLSTRLTLNSTVLWSWHVRS